MSASLKRGKSINDIQDSAREMSRWMKSRLGAHRASFVDHSGLGDKTRVSASDMVNALVRIGPNSNLGSLLKTVNMRDANGNTLENSNVHIVAKTGTLNFVSGLSGFVKTAHDRELAFAIFSADLPRRAAISPQDRERPAGGKNWVRRARVLQWGLINRWVSLYG